MAVSAGPGQPQTSWTLTCDPPGGTHPDPEGACRAIAAARHPFEPVPADMHCTQVYGGPETAVISGTWQGRPIEASLSAHRRLRDRPMEGARSRAGPRQPELTGLDRYLTRTGDLTIVVPRTPVASISVVTVPVPFAVPRTVRL